MADINTDGTGTLRDAKYQSAKPLRSDIAPDTSCPSSELRTIGVNLAGGSVEVRFTPKPPEVLDAEKSTS